MNQKKKSELTNSEIAVIEVTEEYLRDRIYYIRGHKVLLDADIAEIYGYTNKRFNEQVRNNIIKFDSDFMFELSDDELEDLRTKFSSANISSKSRYNPHVFTEQSLIGQREVMQLSMQTIENTAEISKIRMDIGSVEKHMSDVMDQLNDVVTKSELADMMNSFVSDEDNGWLLYNTKYCSADVAYSSIYGQAKKSVYVIDNYIGLRTLVMLKNVPSGVDIKLFSDNVGSGKLHNVEYNDFLREYPGLRITMQHTGGVFHDRFIVLDYGTKDERVFLCGASSKDAGARITTIVEDFGVQKYDPIIKKLLKNAVLVLP